MKDLTHTEDQMIIRGLSGATESVLRSALYFEARIFLREHYMRVGRVFLFVSLEREEDALLSVPLRSIPEARDSEGNIKSPEVLFVLMHSIFAFKWNFPKKCFSPVKK
jgi:hypothetical protein